MRSVIPRDCDDADGTALADFLRHAFDHDRMPTVIPSELVLLGWIGSAITVLASGLALVISDAHAFGHGGFFLLFGSAAAGIVSAMHMIAIPVMLLALLLAALTNYLRVVPAAEQWRLAVPAQATLGASTGVMSGAVLIFILVNLIIWIALMTLIMFAVGVFIVGLFSSG